MQKLIFLISLIFSKFCFAQINSSDIILAKSKDYYQSLTQFSTKISVKFKSSISEDTSTALYRCYINKQNNKELFTFSDIGVFKFEDNLYDISFIDSSFTRVKKKESIYTTRFQYYPFILTPYYFQNLSKLKYTVKENDSLYILSNLFTIREFRKKDYSLKREIIRLFDSQVKKFSYEETSFSIVDSNSYKVEEKIAFAEHVVTSNKKTIVQNKKHVRVGDIIDLSFLRGGQSAVLNEYKDYDGKRILIDFFYEACMPCYKSIPEMRNIFELKNNNLTVIAVNPRLDDTTNIKIYTSKNNIPYPIYYGKKASVLSEKLNIEVFPTLIVVDSNGKVLDINFGHNDRFFNRIKKQYL